MIWDLKDFIREHTDPFIPPVRKVLDGVDPQLKYFVYIQSKSVRTTILKYFADYNLSVNIFSKHVNEVWDLTSDLVYISDFSEI